MKHSRLSWSSADDFNDVRPRSDIWEVWLPLLQLLSQPEKRGENQWEHELLHRMFSARHSDAFDLFWALKLHSDWKWHPEDRANSEKLHLQQSWRRWTMTCIMQSLCSPPFWSKMSEMTGPDLNVCGAWTTLTVSIIKACQKEHFILKCPRLRQVFCGL